MNYFKLMDELFDLCIIQVDDTGMWYLSPHWRKLITDFNASDEISFTKHLDDERILISETEDILKLEVKRRNAYMDRKMEVRAWLYDLITSTVEPAVLQEETDYIKNVMEYMKLNDSLKDKEKELEAKETVMKNKDQISSLVPNGMTFKKGIQ